MTFLEWLARPAWVIDAELGITGMNARGRDCLRVAKAMRESAGRLGPAAVDRRGEFARRVCALLERADRGETAPREYLSLPGSGTAVSMALCVPASVPSLRNSARLFLVVLHQAHLVPDPDLLLWQAAFGFTAAESRACRKIYDGLTLKEAADLLGIGVCTIKSQLDSAYSKAGARNKVELVQSLRSLT